MQITVCSGRVDPADKTHPKFSTTFGVTGTSTYSNCYLWAGTAPANPVEDAGGPNDSVVVMVDFNHPFLTPFLQLAGLFQPSNTNWTMTHLESTQVGVVESFRTARMNSWSPNNGVYHMTDTVPSNTPTNTSTASSTFTPTSTDTATSTPTSRHAKFAPCSRWAVLASLSVAACRFSPSISPMAGSQDSWINGITIDWSQYDLETSSQTLGTIYYASNLIATLNDTNSPSGWSTSTYSSSYDLLAAATNPIVFNYSVADTNPLGVSASTFGVTITLNNGCTVFNRAATPTNTARIRLRLRKLLRLRRQYLYTFEDLYTFANLYAFEDLYTFEDLYGDQYETDEYADQNIHATGTKTNTPTKTNTYTPSITLTPSMTFTNTKTPCASYQYAFVYAFL